MDTLPTRHAERSVDLVAAITRPFMHWGLPFWATDFRTGEKFVTVLPPTPDAELPVDLTVAPAIYDDLVAEVAAGGLRPLAWKVGPEGYECSGFVRETLKMATWTPDPVKAAKWRRKRLRRRLRRLGLLAALTAAAVTVVRWWLR